MKKLLGIYNISDGVLETENKNISEYENDTLSLSVCGRVWSKDNTSVNDMEYLASLVSQKGLDAAALLCGQYLCVWYNKQKKTVTIFSDITTSPLDLYYCENNGKVFYSTSLKELLLKSGIKRELDHDAAEEFIVNGFTNNQRTLIKGVSKQEAFHALCFDGDGIHTQEVVYDFDNLSENEGTEQWQKRLDDAILRCVKDEDEIYCAISGGYDSNYILFSSRNQTAKKVNAFSVGGKRGKNEIPAVEENLKNYDGVMLKTALTDENTLQNYPEIVYHLEGAMYENGIFLQYVLLNMLRDNKVKYLVCGECADQVMNPGYWNEKITHPKVPEKGQIPFYEFSEFPFEYGSNIILKKNGIMSNAYDVEGRYPFLDSSFMEAAKATTALNGKTKEFHKKKCRELLPPTVIKNIMKVGGATECRSMFPSKSAIRSFIRAVEESDTYREFKEHFVLESDKTKRSAKEKLSEAVKSVLCTLFGFRREQRERDADFREEMLLRKYVSCMNIILFRKIFISGKYDDKFLDGRFDMSLNDFIK